VKLFDNLIYHANIANSSNSNPRFVGILAGAKTDAVDPETFAAEYPDDAGQRVEVVIHQNGNGMPLFCFDGCIIHWE
jgi:hypothetical protein